MSERLLEVSDLRVRFPGDVDALRGVDLSLERGETLAIVGESGAGKSTLAHCIAGLVRSPAASGSVRVAGQEVIGGPPEAVRSIRWSTVAIALQNASFNPVVRIGEQVAASLRERAGLDASRARSRMEELTRDVGLGLEHLDRFPHELSGGQTRRAMLAATLCLDPDVVVLDEPTAGLDPPSQRELLERIRELVHARGAALLVISHDLSLATQIAASAVVLYAGEVVEAGPSRDLIERPEHPYAWALVHAHPTMRTTKDLRPIRGRSPDPRAVPPGCAYHPRCTQAEEICSREHPALASSARHLVRCHFGGLKVLLSASDLRKEFGGGRKRVVALDGVELSIRHGEALGIIGASGSGKSTLARILAGHLAPDEGDVTLGGEAVSSSWSRGDRSVRRRVQLVMQDPWEALSPRLTLEELVREPLDVIGRGAREEDRKQRVREALEGVGLPTSGAFLETHTHELSGGQLQRVALARALVARPKILIADEPTSMLDASEQARFLVVLRELQGEMGLALVLISHDVALVRKVTDRIIVLDSGRIAEEGRSEDVSTRPRSVAGRRLVEAATADGASPTP